MRDYILFEKLNPEGTVKESISTKDMLMLTKWHLTPGEPVERYVTVPFRNGALDLTESLTGSVTYGMGICELSFKAIKNFEEDRAKINQLISKLNGKRCKVTLPDETIISMRPNISYRSDGIAWDVEMKGKCNV